MTATSSTPARLFVAINDLILGYQDAILSKRLFRNDQGVERDTDFVRSRFIKLKEDLEKQFYPVDIGFGMAVDMQYSFSEKYCEVKFQTGVLPSGRHGIFTHRSNILEDGTITDANPNHKGSLEGGIDGKDMVDFFDYIVFVCQSILDDLNEDKPQKVPA